jgi:Protein of unknown function (DUF2510)
MTSSTQPGWYDDPEDANGQRYWDGQAWTPHRQQKPVSQPSSAPPPQPAPAPSGAYPPPAPQQAAWQAPGYPPAGPSPRRSNNLALIIGVIVGAIVLVVGGIFGVKHLTQKHPASPEDQIKSLVQREVDAWNRFDFAFDPTMECKANEADDQKHIDESRQDMEQTGNVSVVSVANIHVTGESATADVTYKGVKLPDKPWTANLKMVREDGKWKDCTPPDSSSDDDGSGDQGG